VRKVVVWIAKISVIIIVETIVCQPVLAVVVVAVAVIVVGIVREHVVVVVG
jgi:hypothetical protein